MGCHLGPQKKNLENTVPDNVGKWESVGKSNIRMIGRHLSHHSDLNGKALRGGGKVHGQTCNSWVSTSGEQCYAHLLWNM